MSRRVISRGVCVAGALMVAVALAGCVPEPGPEAATPTAVPSSGIEESPVAEPSPEATASASASAGESTCTSRGGTVQHRQPTVGTNNDPTEWTEIGDPVALCAFTDAAGESGSSLYVDLVTLSSPRPTLAALAYLSLQPMADGDGGDPAAAYCDDLGGASAYGPSLNGGGLVDADDPVDTVIAVCTFADGSFIDEWALAYHSADTIRGVDLAPLFRFDPGAAPDVFSGAAG